MLFELRRAFKRGGKSDICCLSTLGINVMRLRPFCIAVLLLPTSAVAQEQPAAGPRRIIFDTTASIDGEAADDNWGISEFVARQPRTPASGCAAQSDFLVAGAPRRPQYDANGALIPACAAPAAADTTTRRATPADDGRMIVQRESSGGCTEDRLTGTRTCSSRGTVSVGNSQEGRDRARQMVDDLLDDLSRD